MSTASNQSVTTDTTVLPNTPSNTVQLGTTSATAMQPILIEPPRPFLSPRKISMLIVLIICAYIAMRAYFKDHIPNTGVKNFDKLAEATHDLVVTYFNFIQAIIFVIVASILVFVFVPSSKSIVRRKMQQMQYKLSQQKMMNQ